MKKLPINHFVTFEAEGHTYTTQFGDTLSGITSIIHKYIFPNMYSGVSSTIMEAARLRGSGVHDMLEQKFNKVAYNGEEFKAEYDSYCAIEKEHKLKQIAAEYLVSDNEHIATCIDSIVKTKGGVALIDYKTTSVLQYEYLQWQLSIEALLFEQQTNIKVTDLYAVHLPKPKDGVCDGRLVRIERLQDEFVNALIKAFIDEAESFDNPLHALSDDTNDLLEQYKQAEIALLELNASVDYYKGIQSDIKARLKEQMDAQGANKWDSDYVTITRGKDSVRKTFKLDMLQEMAIGLPVQEWITENAPKCYTETKVNGNITIKFK